MRRSGRLQHGSISAGVRRTAQLLLATALSACGTLHQVRLGPGEQPTLVGPPVRDNSTPMDAALACLSARLAADQHRRIVIAVGDVRDYTGKYSVNEGNAITQGGALMVSSALGKLGDAIGLAERFDPTIGERELGYTDKRQLGDGAVHDVAGEAGPGKVAWLPYYGGSIAASDYYIVGGVTELNYDIRSGGFDIGIDQTGPKARSFTQSVAIDLRIVDTRSLLVVKTISLTKQFTGYEVGLNLFRFFGSSLFDINLGAKGEEPLQLGVRTALEEGTLRLVAAVAKIDSTPCLGQRGEAALPPPLPAFRPIAASSATRVTTLATLNVPNSAATGDMVSIPFDFASASLAAGTDPLLDRIGAGHRIEITLLAHDSEMLDPAQRSALTDRRIAALTGALNARGIHRPLHMLWRADPAAAVTRSSVAGYQDVARLQIGD